MKYSSISDDFFKLCEKNNAADELLYNTNRRPYILIAKLMYKGNNRLFALPFRSDISATTPSSQYLSLPPRPTTKPGRKHGLHYIKMFPIDKKYLEKFNTDNDPYYDNVINIIDKNEKLIVETAQAWLTKYENEGRPKMAPDIDKIIEVLEADK